MLLAVLQATAISAELALTRCKSAEAWVLLDLPGFVFVEGKDCFGNDRDEFRLDPLATIGPPSFEHLTDHVRELYDEHGHHVSAINTWGSVKTKVRSPA